MKRIVYIIIERITRAKRMRHLDAMIEARAKANAIKG